MAPRIADELSGDCKALACVTGELEVVPDDTDIPEDDGIGCTIERCAGTSLRPAGQRGGGGRAGGRKVAHDAWRLGVPAAAAAAAALHRGERGSECR